MTLHLDHLLCCSCCLYLFRQSIGSHGVARLRSELQLTLYSRLGRNQMIHIHRESAVGYLDAVVPD
jgi:hypothetical protein